MNPLRFVSTILGYLKQQPAAVGACPAYTGVNMILLLAYLVWNNTKDKKKTRFRHKNEIYCACSETNSTRAKTASGSTREKTENVSQIILEETPSPPSLIIRREESPIRLPEPEPEPEKISLAHYNDMEGDDEAGPAIMQCQMVRIVDLPSRNNSDQRREYSTFSTSTSYSSESKQPKSVKRGKKKSNKRLQKAYKGARRNKRRQS